jgi:hypothetical protein
VGVTEPAQTGVPHIHRYFTVTSVNHGHTHVIQGVTGPAIDVPGGGHIIDHIRIITKEQLVTKRNFL